MPQSLLSPVQIEVDGLESVKGFQNVQTNCWQSFIFTGLFEYLNSIWPIWFLILNEVVHTFFDKIEEPAPEQNLTHSFSDDAHEEKHDLFTDQLF